jgi:5'-methylthioadenosine phosphorylase
MTTPSKLPATTVPPFLPRIGIIGGSGLGNALLAAGYAGAQPVDLDTPFGKPSAPIILADWGGVPIAFLARHGIGHTIPPTAVPYRANTWALKALNCQWIIASGAVGSLRAEIAPRDLVLVDQIIDKTTRRVGTYFDEPGGGAVHVEFAEPICPVLRKLIYESAEAADLKGSKLHPQGTYVCMEGPAFSTRAESLMHRAWGGDLIGMTAMPEAKLAREAEISYALIALSTDYDCWKPHADGGGEESQSKQALLAEIIGHMHAATDNALALVKAAVPHVWAHRTDEFPAHRALELAIWTDKTRIPPATRERLDLLWSKYF